MNQRILSVIIRNQVAALAILVDGEVRDVRRRHLRRRSIGCSLADYLADSIRELIARHAPTVAVVEPGSIAEIVAVGLGLPCVRMPLAEAKVLISQGTATHAKLYDVLVEQVPWLRSLVRTSPATGRILASETERVRTVGLLAVALGLAARQQHSA